jgi:hypothetical protein
MDRAYDKESVQVHERKRSDMAGIKIRKNAIVKADTERADPFSNCCDFVACRLDESRHSEVWLR